MKKLNNKKGFIPDYDKFRIFQIGFNKCGTTSLFRLFQKNGIPSVHYDSGNIADAIYDNYKNKRPLISHKYRKKVFFSDMEHIYNTEKLLYIGRDYFKQLDKEYPNSKFILNIRNKDNWIKSRCNHDNGGYLEYISIVLDKSKEDVIKMWSEEWDSHHLEVISYFKNRPKDLLVFNIERDEPAKIQEFFKPYLELDMDHYGHYGKT